MGQGILGVGQNVTLTNPGASTSSGAIGQNMTRERGEN